MASPSSDVTGFLPDPVKGVSTAFAFLFIISSLLHIWQCSKYKSWAYTWPLPFTSIIFTASFICREITAFRPVDNPPLGAIYGLFYTAVFLTSYTLYLCLIQLLPTQPTILSFRPVYLFVAITCFFSLIITITPQGAASFFNQDAPDKNIRSGLALLKSSMLIQLFLNIVFIAIVAFFHHRCSSKGIFQQSGERSTKILTITFYIFVAWIIVCNLFGTIQIFVPSDSPAWTTEAYWWVFDATPMLVCTALLHILPPAKYLQDICNRYAASATSPGGQDNDFELGQKNRC
ncbi:hypothetical protein Egran_02867 [Elaphomyces granulatus]|uniref:Uncharacterized protein n=1 Tax=Elaphomyces granulatus TaxID=519963 RepID=A0A232LYX5_9EURO|nr:hypothetical protein Egran_02867 [Elaphomyces granulatus]